jgi:hypothetical protein
MRQSRRFNASAKVETGRQRGDAHVKQLGMAGFKTYFDTTQRLTPGELRKGHDAKQVGATERAHTDIALVRSMMRPKVFHGTNSIPCANSVLPTFMRHSRSSNPESIANEPHTIQIVDTHNPL